MFLFSIQNQQAREDQQSKQEDVQEKAGGFCRVLAAAVSKALCAALAQKPLYHL
jgi:hypothetical protein